MVVKDNTLINASYTLGLTEQRIILLSIAKAQKENKEINHTDYVSIHAGEFLDTFSDVNEKSVYASLKDACETLFRREFSYKLDKTIVRSHWVQSSKYHEDTGHIEILFAKELIPFISQLKSRFTSYFLEDVSKMSSVYAIRLYELIIAWKSTHKTPVFALEDFRNKLGVEPHEYPRMTNFKDRVLNPAIEQINKLSNIQIEMEQHKKGRSIIGFSFTFVEFKEKEEKERDPNTVDWIDESDKGNSFAELQTITAQMTGKKSENKKRTTITQQQAEQLARVGESWEQLLERIKGDYFVKFDKKPNGA